MYKINATSGVTRIADGSYIPNDPNNADYTTYLHWLASGNMPAPADVLDTKAIAATALAQLEQTTMMNRGLREFMMVSMQDLAQRQSASLAEHGTVISPQDILNGRPGWVKLVEINSKATQLRSQL